MIGVCYYRGVLIVEGLVLLGFLFVCWISGIDSLVVFSIGGYRGCSCWLGRMVSCYCFCLLVGGCYVGCWWLCLLIGFCWIGGICWCCRLCMVWCGYCYWFLVVNWNDCCIVWWFSFFGFRWCCYWFCCVIGNYLVNCGCYVLDYWWIVGMCVLVLWCRLGVWWSGYSGWYWNVSCFLGLGCVLIWRLCWLGWLVCGLFGLVVLWYLMGCGLFVIVCFGIVVNWYCVFCYLVCGLGGNWFYYVGCGWCWGWWFCCWCGCCSS